MGKNGEGKLILESFDVYEFQISRLTFKKLVSSDFAQIVSLHAGEAYAMQNLTRTDRLGLLLTGKVSIIYDSLYIKYMI